MKECLSYFSTKVYGKIFLYLPTTRNTRKNYPCLEEDETDKILSVLKDEFSNLNRRNRAIGLLALLCRIRSCGIANMKLADIDWDKETIRIVLRIPVMLTPCPGCCPLHSPEGHSEGPPFLIYQKRQRQIYLFFFP